MTGASYQSLEKRYRIGKTKIHEIIHEACDVLWDVSQPREMAPPTTEEWMKIEQDFSYLWNFPNCIGALDGKHVVMTAPPGSGTCSSITNTHSPLISWYLLMLITSLSLWI